MNIFHAAREMWWVLLKSRKGVSLGLLMLIGLSASIPCISGLFQLPVDLNSGPLINSILYRVMNQDQTILAIQTGEIDMAASYFDPVHYESLRNNPDIDIVNASRNGYGHIAINCRDPPLNETVLRQAFAYAFDKTRVTSEIFDGQSREHDSLVPYRNGWCIENQLPYHYYTAQPIIGNQILNDSGKFPFGSNGYRTYNGLPFDIEVAYPADIPSIPVRTYRIAVDALLSLHVNASARPMKYFELLAVLDSHGDYDMAAGGFLNFNNNDVDWLAYQYWSEYADSPSQNPSNFMNETYDRCRDQLLHGVTYEEVYNASYWMQRILHEQVPLVVTDMTIYHQAYRTDRFIGHVPDLGGYITGPWTMRRIHCLDGSYGGMVRVAIAKDPDSFNIFTAESSASEIIFNELYSSLYRYGPDLKPYPDLADKLLIETHDDNSDVQNGHTRFTLDIIQNATWSDGVSLTAQDIAFTFNYLLQSGAPLGSSNPLSGLIAVYAPTAYRVVIEYNTESYWHFSKFAYLPIIPKHIFTPDGGIGYDGWSTWNPVFNPEDAHVTCGPFVFVDYKPNQWYELAWNPLFHYGVDVALHEQSSTTSNSTVPIDGWLDVALLVVSFISATSSVIIPFGIYRIYKKRRTEVDTME